MYERKRVKEPGTISVREQGDESGDREEVQRGRAQWRGQQDRTAKSNDPGSGVCLYLQHGSLDLQRGIKAVGLLKPKSGRRGGRGERNQQKDVKCGSTSRIRGREGDALVRSAAIGTGHLPRWGLAPSAEGEAEAALLCSAAA
jgi:hypothetical protein